MSTFKELRKEKKLTQNELAKELGIDQTTVSKWELDKALPDTATLIKLAEFFDVSIDYLLSRSNYYYPDKLLQNESLTAHAMHDTLTREERELVEGYRGLDDKLKKLVRDSIKVYSGDTELISKPNKKV